MINIRTLINIQYLLIGLAILATYNFNGIEPSGWWLTIAIAAFLRMGIVKKDEITTISILTGFVVLIMFLVMINSIQSSFYKDMEASNPVLQSFQKLGIKTVKESPNTEINLRRFARERVTTLGEFTTTKNKETIPIATLIKIIDDIAGKKEASTKVSIVGESDDYIYIDIEVITEISAKIISDYTGYPEILTKSDRSTETKKFLIDQKEITPEQIATLSLY